MGDKISKIKERVLQIAKSKGISYENFSRDIGMTYGSFKGNAKTTPLNSDAIENILTKYPDVNAQWLITGNGSMLKTSCYNLSNTKQDYVSDRSLVFCTDHNESLQRVPLYDLEATAGLAALFLDAKKIKPVNYLSIPNLPHCDGALYIRGDSMYPLLKSGDIILYKQVSDIVNNLFWGEMYLLSIGMDDEDYITVKYIHKSESSDHVKLVSQNSHHADKDIPIDKIKAMALVKASIRYNTM